MSQQSLDLRRSLQIVWRYRILVGAVALLGLLAGAAYTVLHPPMLSSQAVAVISPTVHQTRTQILIASSDPVLTDALRSLDPGTSIATLRNRIQVTSPAYNIIAITAQGKTAAEAEATANAVVRGYVDYLSSGRIPGGRIQARVLQPAASATGGSLFTHLLITGLLGALVGLLIGATAALAIGRSDRRLRERDEIAESIGVPVLASITVSHPSHTAGWRKLLEEYEPGAVDSWRLRKALQHLDLASGNGSGSSLAVLSLSSDRKALALGPQLAVFAASLGIPTVLVVGPQQDADSTATLRAACAEPSPGRWSTLTVIASDDDDTRRLPRAALTIVVTVVDGKAPRIAGTMRAGATVLGVSAGAATAEQLARVAASAAADGRPITAIFVADPESADLTTGRRPQMARPAQRRMSMRASGKSTESTQ